MEFDEKTFKSITFFGKRFTARHIAMIRNHLKAADEGLTRPQLAKTVPRQMKWLWLTPSGKPRFSACLAAMELLEEKGGHHPAREAPLEAAVHATHPGSRVGRRRTAGRCPTLGDQSDPAAGGQSQPAGQPGPEGLG